MNSYQKPQIEEINQHPRSKSPTRNYQASDQQVYISKFSEDKICLKKQQLQQIKKKFYISINNLRFELRKPQRRTNTDPNADSGTNTTKKLPNLVYLIELFNRNISELKEVNFSLSKEFFDLDQTGNKDPELKYLILDLKRIRNKVLNNPIKKSESKFF